MKYNGKPSRIKNILKPNTWFVMIENKPSPFSINGSLNIPHEYSFDLIKIEGDIIIKDEKNCD